MINTLIAVRRRCHLSYTVRPGSRIQLFLISVALLTLHAYSPVTSIPALLSHSKSSGSEKVPASYYNNHGLLDSSEVYGDGVPGPAERQLANATLFMLARNSDVDSAVRTVKELEDRFNRKYHYPWVFLNEQPFSDDFKRSASPPIPPPLLSY